MIPTRQTINQMRYKARDESYYNFESIRSYFDHRPSDQYYQILSDSVSTDLDLERVFARINRTGSKIGQQFLYARLRTIRSVEDVSRFDKIVEDFDNNPLLLERCGREIARLGSDDGYCFEQLFQNNATVPRKITVPLFLAFLFVSVALLGIFFNGLFVFMLLPILILNYLLHYKNKRNILFHLTGISELCKNF